jgi:hypothetical protein
MSCRLRRLLAVPLLPEARLVRVLVLVLVVEGVWAMVLATLGMSRHLALPLPLLPLVVVV